MCEKCQAPVRAASGSRRRRLWDLPQHCHCPVLGVCLPLQVLRRLVDKAVGGKAIADDYHVHVGAVAESVRRNRVSEALQQELDRRYTVSVQQFRIAKDTDAVAALWKQAVLQGNVSGAFWAALTHPQTDDVLLESLCRDMHMLQHQAGAAVRVDIEKFNEISSENGVLIRELARVQERCTRVINDKSAQINRQSTGLMQLRAQCVVKDSRVAFLTQELEGLKASMPDLADLAGLKAKLQQSLDRQGPLETDNAKLRRQLAHTMQQLVAKQDASPSSVRPDLPAPSGQVDRIESSGASPSLESQTILCVGGRSGNIANYREIIERTGGRFVHHDGGLEDRVHMLDAGLAAADLVICQTGCISHNAYWRVKDFCKRTGKQCVFVDTPSASALERSLKQVNIAGLRPKEDEALTQPLNESTRE